MILAGPWPFGLKIKSKPQRGKHALGLVQQTPLELCTHYALAPAATCLRQDKISAEGLRNNVLVAQRAISITAIDAPPHWREDFLAAEATNDYCLG